MDVTDSPKSRLWVRFEYCLWFVFGTLIGAGAARIIYGPTPTTLHVEVQIYTLYLPRAIKSYGAYVTDDELNPEAGFVDYPEARHLASSRMWVDLTTSRGHFENGGKDSSRHELMDGETVSTFLANPDSLEVLKIEYVDGASDRRSKHVVNLRAKEYRVVELAAASRFPHERRYAIIYVKPLSKSYE